MKIIYILYYYEIRDVFKNNFSSESHLNLFVNIFTLFEFFLQAVKLSCIVELAQQAQVDVKFELPI